MLGGAKDAHEIKNARMLLLKAAKMGMATAQPDPFALLGVWYESQKDKGRATGCYQKALVLEPSHPVAGRGLQRLLSSEDLQPLCESAANRNSSSNGWAWRALGHCKARDAADDAAAAVCYQQALRCRDIQAPDNDTLGFFYSDPTPTETQREPREASETWAELAACYRRLGKYSAALRSYEAAYSVSDGNLSSNTLCAWAQGMSMKLSPPWSCILLHLCSV